MLDQDSNLNEKKRTNVLLEFNMEVEGYTVDS